MRSEAAGASLCKCVLLIPLTYNDGTEVPPELLARIEGELYDRFAGYTIAGTAAGAYRMADGTRADDRALVVWVALPPERIGELRRSVARFGRELRQESMYFEVVNTAVEFIAAERP